MAKARSENRGERLAQALKENLRRRKARRRASAEAPQASKGAPADEAQAARPDSAAKPQ